VFHNLVVIETVLGLHCVKHLIANATDFQARVMAVTVAAIVMTMMMMVAKRKELERPMKM